MDRLHSLRLLRTVAEGDATGLGRIEIFFDPRDESVLDEDAHHGVHFDPPAIRPDTAHRVLGHDAARCRNRSEEHTSELQSLMRISYAVFCLKKKKPI